MMDIESYILSHSDKEPEYLSSLSRKTWLRQTNPRMVSGHLQGRVLSMISKMLSPDRILELGTFTGYSALCLAEGLSEKGRLDTIEIDDELEEFILENFSNSPFNDKIQLYIGDALQILPTLNEVYDLIFIDANKRNYTEYYELSLLLLKSGGFILADNTLWNGKVIEDTHDEKDEQTLEILHFNQFVAQDNRVEKIILPLRDGLTLIRKL